MAMGRGPGATAHHPRVPGLGPASAAVLPSLHRGDCRMTSDLELHPDLVPAPMFTSVMPSASDLAQYWELASRLCRTEFVPSNLRGKPEAVLAVFLTGRELGIGPMQSLRDIYPVNGRPTMMATLMVSRVRALGHRFTTIKSTDTEAVVQI